MNPAGSILIIEDELITAESISSLLEEEDYQVSGIAKDSQTALKISAEPDKKPEVIICDINIKGEINGIALSRKLKSLYDCQVIFLTAYSDTKTLELAFAEEPVMYLVKPYNDTQLLVAVQMAFHRSIRKNNSPSSQKLDLTARELEVALLVAKGMSSKQISRSLNISVETVKTHRRRMLQKNNISNFAQLVFMINEGGR